MDHGRRKPSCRYPDRGMTRHRLMVRLRQSFSGMLLGGVPAVGGLAAASGGTGAIPSVAVAAPADPAGISEGHVLPAASRTAAAIPDLLGCVAPTYREGVARCLRQPTVSARARGEAVVCTKAVYEWLLDHPDRVALAWQRRQVPCLPIQARHDGSFGWTDECGSEVVWRTVGRFRDGRIWYARGSIKPSRLAPPIPVEGVVIFHHPILAEKDGVARFAPRVECYMHSDSRMAHLAVKILGPSVSDLADHAAAQLIEFFSAIAAYVQNHPEEAPQLLGPARP